MKMHLSQPGGIGACEGQHGMSIAIASDICSLAEVDISASISSATGIDASATDATDIDASGDVIAMTGRDSGARAMPAIIKAASSRRMVVGLFTA